jgi:hypothetical protein
VSENYFLSEKPAPASVSIAAALGEQYPPYESLLDAAPGFERDWKHYGRM